jgi:hypothetical protein
VIKISPAGWPYALTTRVSSWYMFPCISSHLVVLFTKQRDLILDSLRLSTCVFPIPPSCLCQVKFKMSSISHHPEDPSAGQGHRNSAGQAQKQTYDQPRPSQAMPLSAHQYYQQKRNESPPGEKMKKQKKEKKKNNNNRGYLICPIHVCPHCLSVVV